MSVEKKVPEIRFKKFSLAWQNKKIGSILAEIKRPVKLLDNEIYQLVTVKRRNEGIVPRSMLKGKNILVKNYYGIKAGDYLISKRQVVHGANGAVPEGLDNAVVSNEYLVVTDSDEITAKFWSVISKRPEMHKLFFISSYGVDIEKLVFDVSDWKNRAITVPDVAEQNAITDYFQQLDSLINQHQQKHDKLNNIKKAMLEKMFPKPGATVPEIRFKGFSGEWDEIELGEEVTFINGRAYSQEELQDKGKYTILRVGNFYTNSSWYYSDMELSDKYYADYGDLLYTWSASFGPHIWNGDKVIYHYHIWKLELSENIEKLFLLHLLDYDRAKILSGSNGSTMIHITKSAMEAKKVFIPKKDEQIIIGNYFQKLDALINQHQQQISKLNTIKQACLSKMFV